MRESIRANAMVPDLLDLTTVFTKHRALEGSLPAPRHQPLSKGVGDDTDWVMIQLFH